MDARIFEMEIVKEFFESSTIHGLTYISTAKVRKSILLGGLPYKGHKSSTCVAYNSAQVVWHPHP